MSSASLLVGVNAGTTLNFLENEKATDDDRCPQCAYMYKQLKINNIIRLGIRLINAVVSCQMSCTIRFFVFIMGGN